MARPPYWPLILPAEDTAIHDAVTRARLKHPNFKRTTMGKVCVLLEEVGELLWALAFQGTARAKEEMMDCVAVLVRWHAGDGGQ